jgi:oligopeptide transport system substrate-binding protein
MARFLPFVAFLFLIIACDPKKPGTASPLGGNIVDARKVTGPMTPEERLATARKLLAEAGFPDGKGFPKLEVLYNTDEGHKKIAAALQQMWRKNLGIDVELRNTEWKVYLDDMSKMRYQIIRRGWIGDYRDPNTFIELFESTSGNNNTGWSNTEFDRLVHQAGAEPEAMKRLDLLRQAEKILMEEMPAIPLYFYVSSDCWKEEVKGVYSNIQDIHPLKEAWVEGRDTLTLNNATEIQTLDPGLARGQPEHRIGIALFEGLTTYDPKSLDPRPGVAEKWEVSPDGRKYVFHLRDCEWSDGRKVSAHDFVFAWLRILDPATPTDYAHLHYFLKGAEAFNQKKTSDRSTVGVRAVDDRTLEVELENPCPFFPELCAFFTYYPVRKDVLEKHGGNWTRPENIVTNGPFRLTEWKLTDVMTVEKNPKYWDAAKVRLARIRFLPVENRSTAWNLYKEGQCDWVTTLPLELIDELVKRPDYHGDTFLATYYYSFNVTQGVLKDKRVRRALALAVDRETITSKITKQGQKPAYHITPPIFSAYRSPRLDERE